MRRSNGKKTWIIFLSLATALLVDSIDTKVEDVAPDIVPASPSYSESLGASHGKEGTRKVVTRRWVDYASEKEEAEDQPQDDLPDEEEPLDSDEEARKNEEVIQSILDKLNEVTGTIMSNLHKTARDHLQMCRSDVQFRCANPNPNAPKGTGPIVPHMSETFGPDHKALEGFDEYEESLKAALVDEMTSLLKKADLAKDTPMPSILQKEKEKDRKIDLARLTSAAKGTGRGAPGATAKPKPRPRSKSSNFPGVSGNRAEMESKIIAQAKIYTAAAKKIVPTSSNSDDLGRAVMSHRQANDQRRPMKFACFDSDRIRKINFDREGKGDAYTEIGETYGHVLARLANANISPVFPISEEWLPEGAGAWLTIDGDGEKDNPDDVYPSQPFMHDTWSNKDQVFWKKASMELNAALRHPSEDPPHLRLPLHENGWASTLDSFRHLRLKVVKFPGIFRGTVGRICSTGFSVSRYVISNTDISWPGPQIIMGSEKRGVIFSLLDSFALRADIAIMWPNWSMINLHTRGFHPISPVISPVPAIKRRGNMYVIFFLQGPNAR